MENKLDFVEIVNDINLMIFENDENNYETAFFYTTDSIVDVINFHDKALKILRKSNMALNDYSDDLFDKQELDDRGKIKQFLQPKDKAKESLEFTRNIRARYDKYHNMITFDDKGMISDKAIVESCAKIMTKEKIAQDQKAIQEIMLTSKRHDEEPYIAGGINNFIKDSKPGDFISYSPPDYSWQRDTLKQPLEFVYTPIHIPKEITNDMLIHNISFTFLEKLDMAWLLIKKAPALIKGFYIIYSSIERFKMTDLKTTILGIVQGILVVLGVIGVNVSPESTTTILTAIGSIFAVIEIIKGWFTKDKEKPKEVK